jgi:hypothetical protein
LPMMVRASEPPMKPFRLDMWFGCMQSLLFLLKYIQVYILLIWLRQESVLFTLKLCRP